MKKYFCDLCGKELIKEEIHDYTTIMIYGKYKDLCPKCYKIYLLFSEKEREEENKLYLKIFKEFFPNVKIDLE